MPTFSQLTASRPFAARAIPITPPMQEWVVETGIERKVARSSQIATDMMTQHMPIIRTESVPSLSLKYSSDVIPVHVYTFVGFAS